MIERTEEDEYREWKNRLASEYLETADMTPRTALRMQANSVTQNLFGNEYLEAYVHNDGRFTMGTREGNPSTSTDDNKILLYGHPNPWSSSTTIRIDGYNYTFKADGPPSINAEGTEAVSVMTVSGVTIRQIISLVNNPSTNRKDVFRIEYQMTNNSGTSRSLGARIMLDTMLGQNDGAPFKVSGIGDVTTEIELVGDDIPQSWQSFDNLLNPSVVSNGILYRNISEKPDKVQFCNWKGIRVTSWDYTINSQRLLTGDSAVGIYFNPKTYVTGQTRTVRTYYGIGDFAQSDLTPPLSMRVIAPSEMEVDAINGDYLYNPFAINVHIQNTGTAPAKNVKLSVSLPPELTLVMGNSNTLVGDLPVGADRQLSFLVRASLQNTDNRVRYSIKLTADNDPGKMMNLPLFLPKVSGAQKLPVIFIPGIFGSTMKKGLSNAGPIRQLVPNLPKKMPANQDDLKVYDNYSFGIKFPGDTAYSDIVKELNKIGYKAYTCPYDWRLSLESIVENNYLQNIIDKAKSESGQDKVILIAHSMGGLVARQYIQSSAYRNDVDTLLMIGTPNNGSAFTYTILEGGEIVDKDNKRVDPIEYSTAGDATANIVVSAYSTMVSRVEELTSKELFDFLYINKRIPAVIGLGAQYSRLLYWESDNKYTNPLVDKNGFESEIAKLNDMSLDSFYQPLTGKTAGKVRTAIFYSNDLETIQIWCAEPYTGTDGRYPDGAVKFTHHAGNRWNPFDNGYYTANFMGGIGDKTVLATSARHGSDSGFRWTEVPMKYGANGKHDKQVNKVEELLRNFIFTSDKIKLDATTINNMKKAANQGKTKEVASRSLMMSMNNELDNEWPAYLEVNVIGNVDVSLTQNSQSVGYTDNYGDDQTVITVVEPTLGDYNLNFSSENGLQHAYFTIEYFNGTDVFLTSTEVAVNGNKEVAVNISENSLDTSRPNYSVTSGIGDGGMTQLVWDQVTDAESYNIYRRNIETDSFVLLGNTNENTYLSNIAWKDTATDYLYVEPVYAGGVSDILMVSVPNSNYAKANFIVDKAFGDSPLTVNFSDQSTGQISSWLWDFGDGETSTEQNPSHTYEAEGKYTVTLTINGPSGESTKRKSNYIVVGKYLTKLDLVIDTEASVGDQINYELIATYSDGSSIPITDGYTLFSSEEDVVSVNGTTLTALKNGNCVINAFYGGYAATKIVKVKDSIVSVSLDQQEVTVPKGTAFEDISLPTTVNITFASGNTDVAPIMWFDDTTPSYVADVDEDSEFVLTGIVDVSDDLLPDDAEAIRVDYTIKVLSGSVRSYQIIARAGEGGKVSGGGTFLYGTTVTLTASPNSNYSFDGWYENGIKVDGAGAAYSFAVTKNRTLEARFKYAGSTSGSSGGDSKPSKSATLSITEAKFDKSEPKDISVVLSTGDYEFRNIKNGNYTLESNKDYSVSGSTYTIKADYLATLADGKATLVFNMSGGTNPTLSITIETSTIEPEDEKPGSDGVPILLNGKESTLKLNADGSVTISEDDLKELTMPVLLTIPFKDGGNSHVGVLKKDGQDIIIPFSVYRNESMIILVSEPGTYSVINNGKTFTDISGHWAANTIDFITARAIYSGVGNNKFDPDGGMTRAMFAQVLANIEGADLTAYGASRFTDVENGSWYAAAVEWAADNGIVDGYGNNLFGPNDLITREQMAVMLYNYIKYKGIVLEKEDEYVPFADDSSISPWAKEAVAAMKQYGLITGVGNNTYDPLSTASRASVAQILKNLIEAYIK